jgi:AraC family transcriptional regulator
MQQPMPGRMRTPFLGRDVCRFDTEALRISENSYAAASRLPRHEHAQAFLCLTLAGGYAERHLARTVDYQPGTLAFHPAGGEHAVAIGSSEARCLNVELRSEWLQPLAGSDGSLPGFVRAVGGPAVWLARRLHEETEVWAATSALAAEDLVLEILALLWRSRGVAADRFPPAWLGTIEEILRDEFASRLSVRGLAARVGVHPVHLSRTWLRFRRSPLGDAVRQLRIDEARRRLDAGVSSLVDLALDLGFADQASFSRAFRRVTGITATAYRRAARRN